MAGGSTSELRRRVLLYGGAAPLIGCLGFFGFVYPSLIPPDAGTLLGIAQLHLGLAEVIPAKSKTGQALPFRAEHLAQAQEALDKAEQVAPGLAITCEFRAFKAWIEGDFPACVRWYEEVLVRSTHDLPMRNKTYVNLAQVRLASGQAQLAQQDLAKVAAGDRDASWHLSVARVHAALGRIDQRTSALRAAVAAAKTRTTDAALMKQVADAAFQWGDAIAASCYEDLPRKGPVEWYRLAKLKIERGEIDSGQNALRSAREAGSAQLVKLVENDREFWTEQQARGLVSFDPVTGNAAVAAPAK